MQPQRRRMRGPLGWARRRPLRRPIPNGGWESTMEEHKGRTLQNCRETVSRGEARRGYGAEGRLFFKVGSRE